MKYFRDEFNTLINSNKNENDKLTMLRKKSFEVFMESGLPTSKWEDWQFTNFSSIINGSFRLSSLKDFDGVPKVLPGRIPNTHLVLIVNGCYQPDLSDVPKEITITSGAEHFKSYSEFYSLESMQLNWRKGLNPFYTLSTSMMDCRLS